MIRLLLTVFLMFIISTNVNALEAAKIEYQVPIDYSKLDETGLSLEAERFYQLYLSTNDEAALQNVLSLYTLLVNINKENPFYPVRVGIAYDKLKNDRYAKSYFYRSMCVQNNYPNAYQAFGDFWFERVQYRKALKNYLYANNYGFTDDFVNNCMIAKCYEKLGDYTSAIKFYNKALAIKNKDEINEKIRFLEGLLLNNSKYDERERRINQ